MLDINIVFYTEVMKSFSLLLLNLFISGGGVIFLALLLKIMLDIILYFEKNNRFLGKIISGFRKLYNFLSPLHSYIVATLLIGLGAFLFFYSDLVILNNFNRDNSILQELMKNNIHDIYLPFMMNINIDQYINFIGNILSSSMVVLNILWLLGCLLFGFSFGNQYVKNIGITFFIIALMTFLITCFLNIIHFNLYKVIIG